jgi:hypothetical protein
MKTYWISKDGLTSVNMGNATKQQALDAMLLNCASERERRAILEGEIVFKDKSEPGYDEEEPFATEEELEQARREEDVSIAQAKLLRAQAAVRSAQAAEEEAMAEWMRCKAVLEEVLG